MGKLGFSQVTLVCVKSTYSSRPLKDKFLHNTVTASLVFTQHV